MKDFKNWDDLVKYANPGKMDSVTLINEGRIVVIRTYQLCTFPGYEFPIEEDTFNEALRFFLGAKLEQRGFIEQQGCLEQHGSVEQFHYSGHLDFDGLIVKQTFKICLSVSGRHICEDLF